MTCAPCLLLLLLLLLLQEHPAPTKRLGVPNRTPSISERAVAAPYPAAAFSRCCTAAVPALQNPERQRAGPSRLRTRSSTGASPSSNRPKAAISGHFPVQRTGIGPGHSAPCSWRSAPTPAKSGHFRP